MIDLTETEEKIVFIMLTKAKPGFSAFELSRMIGKSTSHTHLTLRILQDRGLVGGSRGRYNLHKQHRETLAKDLLEKGYDLKQGAKEAAKEEADEVLKAETG